MDSIVDLLDRLTNPIRHTRYSEKVAQDQMVFGLNEEIGLAWAQTPQNPRFLLKQMALFMYIGHRLHNYWILNQQTNDPKPKNQNGYRYQCNNNNTRGGLRGQNCSQGQISTDQKDHTVELKGIP